MKVVIRGGDIKDTSLIVPGDKSVSHRALLMSLLSAGEVRIKGLSQASDVRSTRQVVEALGLVLKNDGEDIVAQGMLGEFNEPMRVLDVGNSGTLLRLVCGLLAPRANQTFFLTGDSSIVRRPMERVIEPLSAMGARIIGRANNCFAPLAIQGAPLCGITYSMSIPSAQVKSALLLAGLSADGETVVIESVPTRVHTEEMLASYGADIEIEDQEGVRMIRVRRSTLSIHEIDVPGDPSAAAFFLVLGALGGQRIQVDNLYLGPQRDGFINVLRTMGACFELGNQHNGATSVTVIPSELFGIDIGPKGIPSIIDEIPILAVAAAHARGRTRFLGVEELKHKESDRIASTLGMLGSFGIECGELEGGFWVEGTAGAKTKPQTRVIASHFDHRIAMAGAIFGALSCGETIIDEFESVATSFPSFLDALGNCGIASEIIEI